MTSTPTTPAAPMPEAPTEAHLDRDTLDKANMLLNILQGSARTMDNAGTVCIITEDQLPGGIAGYQDAIDHLNATGYEVAVPKNQRDMSQEYPADMKGRTIQLVSVPEGRLLKHG